MTITECSIIIKTSGMKCVGKYPLVDVLVLDSQSHPLKEMIDATIKRFHVDPNAEGLSILVKTKTVVKR